MIMKIFFDASFIQETNVSGISVIIKNENGKNIFTSSKKVICKNTTEAEFRALNKAVGYINNRQEKNYYPKKCLIEIYGDNQGLVEASKRLRKVKNIDRGMMVGFLNQLKILKKNNTVQLFWLSRKHNKEAHKACRQIIGL